VASDVGGHKELIQDGITGILFKAGDPRALADAISRLFAEEQKWPEMRAAGRRFVEADRNWQKSISNYISIYKRLAGQYANHA
jgi:glycosyltransferase involved in cell wall biosynthesis